MFPIFPAKRPFQRSSLVCDVADHSLSLCQKYNALIQSCNLRLKFIYAVAQHAIAIAFLFRAALIQRVLGLTRVAIRDTHRHVLRHIGAAAIARPFHSRRKSQLFLN
jgi:hypothetical protein